jgi:hypothetical protein
MTESEFLALDIGDIIRNEGDAKGYVVTGNYRGRVTAVKTVDATNPDEWILVSKATYKATQEN